MVDESDFRPSSPVIADQWLLPDEKAFTDFGQWGEGRLDARVFEQNIWWVDIKGNPHLLTEMSTEYLTNVLGHIFNNLEHFHITALHKNAIELMTPLIAPALGMEVEEGYIQHLEDRADISSLSAVEWMNASLLVQKIKELLDAH